MSQVEEILLSGHTDVLIKVRMRIRFHDRMAVLPVSDGWKCRSTSDNGTPSRELRRCLALICCVRPPDDLQTLGHRSQGKTIRGGGHRGVG